MARIAQNKLTIESIQDSKGTPSGFRLFGYFNGKKIRKVSDDLSELETLKTTLETSQQVMDSAEQLREMPRLTWLTIEQVRDAEAAFRNIAGAPYPLAEYITTAKPLMGGPAPKLAMEAMTNWIAHQKDRGRFYFTLKNNKREAISFLKETKVKFLAEITSVMVDKYISREELSISSKAAMAARLSAWFNFCVGKEWLRANPCKVDITEMKETAGRLRSKDRILKVEQCEALLQAAIAHKNGIMVPYVILATWCFMRSAEVRNTNPKDIRLTGKSAVHVWGRKQGGTFRVVGIPDNVVGLLKEALARGLYAKNEADAELDRIHFSMWDWIQVRNNAGLIKATLKGAKYKTYYKIEKSDWQENILRHTGESYLYQKTGDITLCTNQAGHSKEMAFRHYLQLPQDGASEKFYAITGQLPALEAPVIPMKKAG